ncbi:MAG: DUF4209 domain-containing protein, partial [Sandaracinaceae bacterium]|nr:DUF4209 domain-containing protein [Sandaracinaceae bacterium]
MHPTISPASADSELVSAPASPVGAGYRWRLAEGLRSDGDPVQGVDRRLLADVIDVPPTRTWSTALHSREAGGEGPFSPRITLPDGRRSFLPQDLAGEHQAPLRAIAQASANPFVRGVIFDVLWVRFRQHTDARAAVDARIAAAGLIDVDSAWFEVTAEINRAALLAMEVNDTPRLQGAVALAVEDAGRCASALADPGAFVGVASDLTFAVLLNRGFVRAAGAHGERWGIAALFAARELRRRGDLHRAEDALVVAAELLTGSKQPDLARQARAERIDWMLERADAEGGIMRAHLVQAAIDEATSAGLTDLATAAKTRLRDAVKDATASMKGISFDIRLPAEIAKALHETALRPPTAPFAVRSLAVAPWLTSMPVTTFGNAAREEAQEALFLHMIPSVQYRDGKVSGLASSSEEKLREAVGRHASLYLAHSELAADHFLSIAFPRFDAETLLQSIGRPSWMDARRLPWLARASERFAAQDFASCGAIVLTQYEGMLRDLARAAGHHAIKYDAGTTQDETLNSLLRVPAVRELLREEHAWFVEFFLCRSDMGPNLRNELAHGNLDAR